MRRRQISKAGIVLLAKKAACANILGSEAVMSVLRTGQGERAPEARPHSYSGSEKGFSSIQRGVEHMES